MRDRLIELLKKAELKETYTASNGKPVTSIQRRIVDMSEVNVLADHLLANGVIVPPCKVGDKVYFVSDSPINLSVRANTIYEAHVSRTVTTQYGTTLVVQIHNSYGCTEIPDINDFGKTVFLTREEAEKALKGGAE